MVESFERYLEPGPLTDPGPCRSVLADLPADLPSLVGAVQGLLVHVFWAERYGTALDDERLSALRHRSAGWKLARILELDPAPLAEPRPLDRRLVGNCRDFTLLLTTFLRHRGVPARARCGFATYFLPDHYEDHWVCERWDARRGTWVLVDAQLDEFQREALGIDFDPLDVPRDRFIVGGRAWQLCRTGAADPECFGIQAMHGLWFVRGDLVRDVAALQNAETLPWDVWGLVDGADESLSPDDWRLLDHVAELTSSPNAPAGELARTYADPRLTVPPELLL